MARRLPPGCCCCAGAARATSLAAVAEAAAEAAAGGRALTRGGRAAAAAIWALVAICRDLCSRCGAAGAQGGSGVQRVEQTGVAASAGACRGPAARESAVAADWSRGTKTARCWGPRESRQILGARPRLPAVTCGRAACSGAQQTPPLPSTKRQGGRRCARARPGPRAARRARHRARPPPDGTASGYDGGRAWRRVLLALRSSAARRRRRSRTLPPPPLLPSCRAGPAAQP